MFGKLGDVMKKAQEVQENMQKMQAELAEREVTGVSGAGAVQVTVNGLFACQKLIISDEAMTEGKEMLEALIAAAFNDAINKAREMSKEQMSQVTHGLNLPDGFKFPF